MAKAKKAAPKKKVAVKKKTGKTNSDKLGLSGGKGGILPLSGKPVKTAPSKKTAVIKKAVSKKAAKTKSIKLGTSGKSSG